MVAEDFNRESKSYGHNPSFSATVSSGAAKLKSSHPEKLNPKPTHRLQSSSFLGLPWRILNMNHKLKGTTLEPMGSFPRP